MKSGPTRRESFDIAGCKISAVVAGNPNHPAVLLLHGFPSSSRTFRNIVPRLSQACFVIAPDLPGFGQSDLIADPSFVRFTDLIEGLLAKLGVLSAYLYLHDFGAPVGLDLAMRDPSRVLGLIVQNANAHRTGFGPAWQDTIDYWHAPSKENERAATAHLTFEGLRNEYVGGVPDDIASRISADNWIEDWRTMSQPGHLDCNVPWSRTTAATSPASRILADTCMNISPRRSCCGDGTTATSTAPKSSPGYRTCRAWKRMFSMARTCSSRLTPHRARS
jgi:pimeloyl-ACP methyl ester carboxylesterase